MRWHGQPEHSTIWRRYVLGIAFGAALIVEGVKGAPMGEPYPHAYGKEPCVTLAYDMATESAGVDAPVWDMRMNLFSCDQRADGSWHFREGTYGRGCGLLAYATAKDLLGRGYSSLSITPAMIGHGIDKRAHALDCTLNEDWSWS